MEDKTSTLKEELAKIDERIEELKNQVQLNTDLEELHEDERFKRVILDGYFEKESERIFGLLTTPSNLKREQLDNLMDKMTSIRNFKAYFQTMIINAAMAPEQIEAEELYRKEVTAEHTLESKE